MSTSRVQREGGGLSAEWLTVRSASLFLDGIAENTIREAISKDELPASYFGRAIRINREDLNAWARSKVRAS